MNQIGVKQFHFEKSSWFWIILSGLLKTCSLLLEQDQFIDPALDQPTLDPPIDQPIDPVLDQLHKLAIDNRCEALDHLAQSCFFPKGLVMNQ